MHIIENKFHMERWYNKLVIVTGADQFIGGLVANVLTNKGLIVMGLAKNIDNVIKIRSQLPTTLRHRLYPIHCDITNMEQVEKAFLWIQNTYGCIDMLINCAGILCADDFVLNTTNDFLKQNIDDNIKGIQNCTMKAFINMKNRLADGHIILMDSLLGDINSKLCSYSKDIINELAETYRKEINENETHVNVKITCITSGFFKTDNTISNLRRHTFNYPMKKANEITNAILYAVSTPPLMQIHEIVIKSQ